MLSVSNEASVIRSQLTAEKRALLEKRLKGGRAGTPESRIPRASKHGKTPLSFSQQRLWFLDNLEPGSPLYNLPSAIRIQGCIEPSFVQEALDSMVMRHEALRTRFLNEEGTAVQVVQEAAPASLRVVELADGETLEQLLDEEVRKPFDLSSGYLMRTLLVRLSETEHVMLVTMHHIISDSWSLTIFFKEFAVFYEAARTKQMPAVPELPLQYVDYALWQRQGLSGEAMAGHLGYWEKNLKDAPPLLELPGDRARPVRQTYRGAYVTRQLPSRLSAASRSLSKQKNVTLFMLLLATFKALIFRYTRQTDLVIGTPIAGRTQFETEGIIGFFVNTLVLRTDLSGNPTFTDLLARIRNVTLESYTHQDYPFEKLVEELQPARSPSYSPIVQHLFALNAEESQHLKLEGLSISPLPVDTGTAKFDLIFTVQDDGGALTLNAEYNVDLFSRPSMERMLRHFETLLGSVLADPGGKIAELEFISPDEREMLLQGWSGRQTSYPAETSLGTLFEEQVALNAEKTALSDSIRRMTYRELNSRVNALANLLLKHGVQPGEMIALFAERSIEAIIAILGIVKAGGAYVALEPSTPQPRLRSMLKDVRPRVVLTQRRFSDEIRKIIQEPAEEDANKQSVVSIIAVDEADTFSEENANPSRRVGSDSLAYVCFTSGSTGVPKGVQVPHKAVIRLVKNTDYAPFGSDEVFLQLAPLAFDASTMEIWGPLLNGGELVVFPPHLPSMGELVDFIEAQKITTLWLTAGLFHQLIEHDPNSFAKLKRVLAGGDVLSPSHVRQVFDKCEVINGYGPTENTTFTCCHRITADSLKRKSVPIGRPIANTRVYILDELGKPVPPLVPGELYTGGDGLALGYLNAPELTADKFVIHRSLLGDEVRLYRTGDIVRWLESGEIEFLGRSDSQVKLRGFRVELGEVENALKKHPLISDCVVVAKERARKEKELNVYYTSSSSQALFAEELRAFLQRTLPDYMIPTGFLRLPQLPLNANGKVDRKALPPIEPQVDAWTEHKELLEPRNKLEKQLVTVWEEVLGIHPVGVRDNFFEMGGHSLLAVMLVSRVERVFGNRIPVAEVFLRPTVEQLAEYLESLRPQGKSRHLVEIQGKGSKPTLFLVHGAGGGMFWGYTNLAHYLGNDQPIVALSSRGMSGEAEYETIEEMAAGYVAELRSYQPTGPYRLGGYCFGGNVAYEMARILEAQGEKVDFLALINCVPPNSSYDRIRCSSSAVASFCLNLVYWVGYFLQLDAADGRNLLWWKLKGVVKRVRRIGARLRRREAVIDVEEYVDLSKQPEERRDLWRTHIHALMSHVPKPYNGHVTLFRTRGHSLWCSFDDSYGWDQLAAGGTSIRYVAGAHESILAEPYVKATANEMRICLQKGANTQT